MKVATQHRIHLGSRRIDYQIVRSKAATQLCVRAGPNGVEVVQPAARTGEDVLAFLGRNEAWILEQLRRAERLRGVRRRDWRRAGEMLFRGEPTIVRIEATDSRAPATPSLLGRERS